jgi:hypothetical protein
VDEAVNGAVRAGKKLSLGITPGVYTPDWVYAAGAKAFHFLWERPWGFAACSQMALPAPWDPVYVAKYTGLIEAFGRRYAANPALTLVKIQGVNAQTGELLLPHRGSGAPPRFRQLDCPADDNVAHWLEVGYRPSKVLAAWRGFAQAYAHAFPQQKLVVDTGGWGMPGIDEAGRALSDPEGDRALGSAIVLAGAAALGEQLVVANAGLGATWNWPRPAGLPARIAFGYEEAAGVTGDRKCRMNGYRSPCDAREVFEKAVRRAVAAKVAYLVIYLADLRNPALTDLVAEAHRALATP